MIVLGPVKELSVGGVELLVVLGELDVEVLDPAELSIDISLLRQFRIIRHSRSFDLVFIVWVKLSLRINHHVLFVLVVFIEQLLKHNGRLAHGYSNES